MIIFTFSVLIQLNRMIFYTNKLKSGLDEFEAGFVIFKLFRNQQIQSFKIYLHPTNKRKTQNTEHGTQNTEH